MLAAPNRLRGDANFKRLLQHGRRFFGASIMVRVIPNDLSQSRFAFVVSTRVHKKAVYRNKIKRRMRELVRHNLPHVRPGFDVLISVKAAALALTYDELGDELAEVFSKARILRV